ncbi:MAG: hypothetical protein QW512_06755 [Thermofilaceae archaeon]
MRQSSNHDTKYTHVTVRLPQRLIDALMKEICSEYALKVSDCIRLALIMVLEDVRASKQS